MALLDSVTSLLRVRIGGATIGLPTSAVRELVRAVAITPLPGAPAIVEGVVNIRGELVPVINVRQRLALGSKLLDPDEFLIVVQTATRAVAFRGDDVDDLVDVDPGAVEASAALSPALAGLAGLAARADGVIVIYDPSAFVSQAESQALDAALAARE